MRIRFNTSKSGFYNEIKDVLEEHSSNGLMQDAEILVLSNENYSYTEDSINFRITNSDSEHFTTDWFKSQASLFPARAKATCTVLRDLNQAGEFRIKNDSSGLTVTRLASESIESHYSWDTVSKDIADKQLDRSAFVYGGTGIPTECIWFFGLEPGDSTSREITLLHNGKSHDCKIQLHSERYRLFWGAEFKTLLKSKLPKFSQIYESGKNPNQNCWLRFKKESLNKFNVSFSTEKSEADARPQDDATPSNPNRVPISGYWTFISKPKIWTDVFKVIAREKTFTHQVRSSDIHLIAPGHLGIMRVGVDTRTSLERNGESRREAGVYAIVEIISQAYLRPEEPIANLNQSNEKQRRTHIVDIRFIKKLHDNPLTIDSLKENSNISDQYLINSFQGSSIPLNENSFNEVVRLANAEEDINSELDKELRNNSSPEISKRFKNASPKMVERVSRRYERGQEGKEIKRLAGRKCQINQALGLSPLTFKKTNGEYYCEAHHVIPVSTGQKDTLHPSNVICVSADRHRQLHYGNAKVVDIRDDEFEFLIDGETVIVPKLIKKEV